jgi:putative hemolysin
VIFLYILVCTVSAGFFAGLETGLLAANRMIIQEKRRRGVLRARSAEFLLVKPERLLATTLVGTNIANVTAAVLLTNFFDQIGFAHLAWLGILIMAFVFLLLNDLVPKSFFRRFADTLAVQLAPLLLVFYYLFLPVNLVLNMLIKLILFFTGHNVARREELSSKRDLRFLINLTGKRVGLAADDQRIIEDIFDFRDQSAREVMIPFYKLPVINIDQKLVDVIRLSSETGYRFIPVTELRTDNMVGYIDTCTLLFKRRATVRSSMKEAVYFPETRLLPDLLLEMNRKALNVVFLSDEYGGVAGMITPVQIVGDLLHRIPEEGTWEQEIELLEPGRYRVLGSTDLQDLSHEAGVALKQGYNSTVGGFLCEKLGFIPDVGFIHEEAGYVFEVKKRDDRHVLELEIIRKK